jgi:hypothetical protein
MLVAMQLFPSFKFIEWTPAFCSTDDDYQTVSSSLSDCTPFHDEGSVIFSVGYFITFLFFFNFGRGNFKETMLIQFISIIALFIILTQFSQEFYSRGFPYLQSSIMFGKKHYSSLGGVVLFNYAFCITVPSWLYEKERFVRLYRLSSVFYYVVFDDRSISVNHVIWTSSILCTIVYVLFAFLAAISFDEVSPNILILLASKKVGPLTRLCRFILFFY